MAMDSMGGAMPAGQPVAVSSGSRSHAFGIDKSGAMNHWMSTNGGPWSAPSPLPGGNLVASVPCAIALPDGSVHVFAITKGGPLSHWSSTDGNIWTFAMDARAPINGGWNGLAAASMGGQRIDVFATTNQGILQYSFVGNVALPPTPALPNSSGLPTRLLAAVSAAPNQIDVFAVDPQSGMPIRWHLNGSWSKQFIAGALHVNSGLAAVVSGPGRIELFGISPAAQMMSWSITGSVFVPKSIPASTGALPEGVPAVVARGGKLDLFAIGQGDVLNGGPLVHWRFDGANWTSPVAYPSGLAAGGVTAIRGTAGLEAFGIQSGINNPLLHWPAGIAVTEHTPWRNWLGNRQSSPEGHCYPQSVEELVAIVRSATRINKRVRAVGSSWSFSDIAMTPGYVVETNKLDAVIKSVLPKALRPQSASVPAAKYLVHVEAGIQVEKLLKTLDGLQLAPYTMGGSSGQTLGGVLSTSVHGSHFRLPPFPDWVRAIHLVGPDGKQYWIEPSDRPITDEAQLKAALGPEVITKRDNDWFDAALVTVGSLGIIYSVVLEVKDKYLLKETRTETKWSKLRPQLENRSAFKAVNDAVQFCIDPGTFGGADPVCFLAERETAPPGALPTGPKGGIDPLAAFCEGNLLLELLGEAAKAAGKEPAVLATILLALPAIPIIALILPPFLPILAVAGTLVAATPILINLLKAAGPGAVGDLIGAVLDKHPDLTASFTSLMTRQAQGPGVNINLAHEIMGPWNKGECAARGLAVEMAFTTDANAHLAYIDAALAMLRSEALTGRALGGYFAVRFVGRSRAILSPQQSQMTCMVEVTGLRNLSSTKVLLSRLEALGRSMGGIQHWGMFDVDMTGRNLTTADVTRAYPRLNTWRKVRSELTNGGTVHTFDNVFMMSCGLTDAASAPASKWKALGGQFTSGPAAVSWEPGRLDIFGRGTDNALYTSSFTGAAWDAWHQLAPNPIDFDPAAIAWGNKRIDVFATGTDKQMYQITWDGNHWSGWGSLGGQFTSGPAVASMEANRLDVFGRGLDNALYTNTWNGAAWSGWHQVAPNPLDSHPAAIARGPGRLDVFARGTDKQMHTISWVVDHWTGWSPLGGVFTSGPAVSSWGKDRLDVFGRGTDNSLYTDVWDGSKWSGWHQVTADAFNSDPAAVSWGPNHIDMFARGTDNQMWTRQSDGN